MSEKQFQGKMQNMRRTAQAIEEAKEVKASTSEGRRNKRGDRRGTHPNSLAAASRNKAKPYPKGVSGNAGGLPGTDLSALVARRVFERDSEAITDGMASQVRKGNAYAFSVLADRGYGKVKDKHEITGAEGQPLSIVIKLVKTPDGDD